MTDSIAPSVSEPGAGTGASVDPAPAQGPEMEGTSRLGWLVSDTLVMAKRSVLHYVRVPTVLFFALVQPIIFLLLFRYVFGNAIGAGIGVDYADYIVPGIILQTALFAATNTSVGLAADMGTGVIDRFRTLPMSRSALLTGRTLADLSRNVIVILLMIIVGYMIGFDFQNGPVAAVGAVGLALVFGWSFSWVGAAIGLSIRNSEAAQSANMLWMFPMMFTSSLFVPTRTLPSWLRAVADVNPITFGVDAVRALSLGGTGTAGKVTWAVVWCLALVVVFIPVSVHLYRRPE